jgi:hypothetical protein
MDVFGSVVAVAFQNVSTWKYIKIIFFKKKIIFNISTSK